MEPIPALGAIESLDWGAYYDFRHNINHPTIIGLSMAGYYLGLFGPMALALLALLLFQCQKRYVATFIAVSASVLAIGAFEAMRFLVPRLRPTDTHLSLDSSGSYPSPVLLFVVAISLVLAALWRWAPSWTARSLLVLGAVLVTVAVCLSHLFLRIHWVTDVIGGLAGGGFLSWIACRAISANSESAARVGPIE